MTPKKLVFDPDLINMFMGGDPDCGEAPDHTFMNLGDGELVAVGRIPSSDDEATRAAINANPQRFAYVPAPSSDLWRHWFRAFARSEGYGEGGMPNISRWLAQHDDSKIRWWDFKREHVLQYFVHQAAVWGVEVTFG